MDPKMASSDFFKINFYEDDVNLFQFALKNPSKPGPE